MSEVTPEKPVPGENIQMAFAAFVSCIADAFPDVCSVGMTIGSEYVPFRPDPDDDCEDDEDDEEFCTQVWVRFTGAAVSGSTGFDGGFCGSEMEMGVEVGIYRCFEMDEDGEAPTATQMFEAALQSIEDQATILCAANACDVWSKIVAGQWTPLGPQGYQYGGQWSFTTWL